MQPTEFPLDKTNLEIGGNVENSNIIIGNNNIIINFNSQGHNSLEWRLIRRACLDISEPRVAFISQRFDTDLFIERKNISEAVDSFINLDGKNIFAIVGNSGYGKSSFLWGLTQKIENQEKVAYLFCDASLNIKSGNSLVTTLLYDLSLVLNLKPEDVLPTIDVSIKNGQKLVIIIDAINEFTRMKDVEYILRDLNTLIAHYKWIKLIVSCRPHFWKYIQSQKGAIGIADKYFFRDEQSGDLFITLGRLNIFEAKVFYAKYQTNYNLEPVLFEDLNYDIQMCLREPMSLWLISEICSGQNIANRSDLIIDVRAVPAYIKKLEDHGELSADGTDRNFLQNTLTKLFFRDGICTNFIPRSYINKNSPHPNTFEIIYRLLRSGILKEDGYSRLGFSFERFWGYFLGLELKMIAKQGTLYDCSQEESVA